MDGGGFNVGNIWAGLGFKYDGKDASKFEQDAQAAERATDGLARSTEQAAKAQGHFADKLSESDRALGRAYDKTGKLREANGRFVEGAQRADGHTKKLSGSLKGLASSWLPAAAGGAALTGALSSTVDKAASFEAQLSSLGAVSDASAGQMAEFKKQAIDAGAATKYSALEAAAAQTELAKGGLSVQEILDGGLKAALGLAAAGEMELADAAATTANSLNLFQMDAKDATHVADALATSANATTADVSDFAMALTQGGAAAKASGMDFDQTVVTLEALAAAGVKNSDAGTSMKSMLVALGKPSTQASALMKQLGLDFFDAEGKFRSVGDVSQMLRSKLGGLTDEQRLAVTTTLAGTDGMRGLLALYDAGPKKLAEYEKGLQKQGSAAEVAAKKQDNFKGAMENFKGSIETLQIVIGEKLLPHLTKAAQAGTKFVGEMQSGKGAGGDFVDTLRSVADVLRMLWPVVSAVAGVVLSLVKAFNGLPQPLKQAIVYAAAGAGAIFGLGKAATAAKAGFVSLKTGGTVLMAFLRGIPLLMGPVGLAIMGLVLVAVLVIKHWDKVKHALGATWNWLKGAASKAFDGVKAAARSGLLGPVALIISRWGSIVSFFRELPGKVKSAFSSLKDTITKPFGDAWDWIQQKWNSLPGPLRAVISGGGSIAGGPLAGAAHSVGLFAEGGKVGPGAGGAKLFVAGEGNQHEYVLSHEGDSKKNVGYALAFLQEKGVAAFKNGGAVAARGDALALQRKAAAMADDYEVLQTRYQNSGGTVDSREQRTLAGRKNAILGVNRGELSKIMSALGLYAGEIGQGRSALSDLKRRKYSGKGAGKLRAADAKQAQTLTDRLSRLTAQQDALKTRRDELAKSLRLDVLDVQNMNKQAADLDAADALENSTRTSFDQAIADASTAYKAAQWDTPNDTSDDKAALQKQYDATVGRLGELRSRFNSATGEMKDKLRGELDSAFGDAGSLRDQLNDKGTAAGLTDFGSSLAGARENLYASFGSNARAGGSGYTGAPAAAGGTGGRNGTSITVHQTVQKMGDPVTWTEKLLRLGPAV